MISENSQIYCVLIAINDDTLLLPNAAVAETVGQDALTISQSGPEWLLGTLEWNQQTLSALRFEALNGGPAKALVKRSRLVVVQSLGNPLDGGTAAMPIALVSQGYPHLITVTRSALVSMPLRAGDDPAVVLARVRIGSNEALIPDLDALKQSADGERQKAALSQQD